MSNDVLYRWEYDDGNITDSGEVRKDEYEIGGAIIPILKDRYGDAVSPEYLTIEATE